jgi:hypothetical protein
LVRIIDKRASGKTSRLMLIAKENNATFVCSNPAVMEAKAHAYGIVGINFISYRDFLKRSQQPFNYVVDELENFIAYMNTYEKRGKMIAYSLSNEE